MRGLSINVKGLGIAVVYGLLFFTLKQHTPLTLNLPIGLRLAAFMMAPPRLWPWLVLGEVGAASYWTLNAHFGHGFSWAWVAAATMLPVFGGLCPAALMKNTHGDVRFDVPLDTATYVGIALFAGVFSAGISTFCASIAGAGVHVQFDSPALPKMFTEFVTGACTANLIMPPLFTVLRDFLASGYKQVREGDATIYIGAASYIIVGSLLLKAIPISFLTIGRCALFAPLLLITMFRGWRGTAAMMAVCCVALQLSERGDAKSDLLAVQNVATAAMAGILLVGSLITQHKQQSAAQQLQIESLASKLRRHSSRAEAQFRHSAGLVDRLHRAVDEADQRIRNASDREAITQSWWSTMKTLRRDLRNLGDMFHPRLLEEKGLRAAIASGPLAHLLMNCNIEFDRRLDGRPSLLSQEMQMSLYRLSYEAACLLLKGGTPETIRLALRIGRVAQGPMYAALRITALAANEDAWRPAVSVLSTGLSLEDISLVAESFDGGVDCAKNGRRVTVLLFEGFRSDPLTAPQKTEAASQFQLRSGPSNSVS